MVNSILERISEANIRRDGFPHAVIEGALPEAYYEELAAGFPSLDYVAGAEGLKSNQAYRKIALETAEDPAMPAIWREFIAYHCSAEFFARLCDVWGPDIAATHVRLAENFGKPLEDFTVGARRPGKAKNPENLTHDVMLDCQLSYQQPSAFALYGSWAAPGQSLQALRGAALFPPPAGRLERRQP